MSSRNSPRGPRKQSLEERGKDVLDAENGERADPAGRSPRNAQDIRECPPERPPRRLRRGPGEVNGAPLSGNNANDVLESNGPGTGTNGGASNLPGRSPKDSRNPTELSREFRIPSGCSKVVADNHPVEHRPNQHSEADDPSPGRSSGQPNPAGHLGGNRPDIHEERFLENGGRAEDVLQFVNSLDRSDFGNAGSRADNVSEEIASDPDSEDLSSKDHRKSATSRTSRRSVSNAGETVGIESVNGNVKRDLNSQISVSESETLTSLRINIIPPVSSRESISELETIVPKMDIEVTPAVKVKESRRSVRSAETQRSEITREYSMIFENHSVSFNSLNELEFGSVSHGSLNVERKNSSFSTSTMNSLKMSEYSTSSSSSNKSKVSLSEKISNIAEISGLRSANRVGTPSESKFSENPSIPLKGTCVKPKRSFTSAMLKIVDKSKIRSLFRKNPHCRRNNFSRTKIYPAESICSPRIVTSISSKLETSDRDSKKSRLVGNTSIIDKESVPSKLSKAANSGFGSLTRNLKEKILLCRERKIDKGANSKTPSPCCEALEFLDNSFDNFDSKLVLSSTTLEENSASLGKRSNCRFCNFVGSNSAPSLGRSKFMKNIVNCLDSAKNFKSRDLLSDEELVVCGSSKLIATDPSDRSKARGKSAEFSKGSVQRSVENFLNSIGKGNSFSGKVDVSDRIWKLENSMNFSPEKMRGKETSEAIDLSDLSILSPGISKKQPRVKLKSSADSTSTSFHFPQDSLTDLSANPIRDSGSNISAVSENEEIYRGPNNGPRSNFNFPPEEKMSEMETLDITKLTEQLIGLRLPDFSENPEKTRVKLKPHVDSDFISALNFFNSPVEDSPQENKSIDSANSRVPTVGKPRFPIADENPKSRSHFSPKVRGRNSSEAFNEFEALIRSPRFSQKSKPKVKLKLSTESDIFNTASESDNSGPGISSSVIKVKSSNCSEVFPRNLYEILGNESTPPKSRKSESSRSSENSVDLTNLPSKMSEASKTSKIRSLTRKRVKRKCEASPRRVLWTSRLTNTLQARNDYGSSNCPTNSKKRSVDSPLLNKLNSHESRGKSSLADSTENLARKAISSAVSEPRNLSNLESKPNRGSSFSNSIIGQKEKTENSVECSYFEDGLNRRRSLSFADLWTNFRKSVESPVDESNNVHNKSNEPLVETCRKGSVDLSETGQSDRDRQEILKNSFSRSSNPFKFSIKQIYQSLPEKFSFDRLKRLKFLDNVQFGSSKKSKLFPGNNSQNVQVDSSNYDKSLVNSKFNSNLKAHDLCTSEEFPAILETKALPKTVLRRVSFSIRNSKEPSKSDFSHSTSNMQIKDAT
ncbi:uncharacterized protein LOC105699222 isoform X2 [Orussus abietinus]|nr:uncharacterized protein LOC105699222 isoform X2 [Orussus abietinus]